MAYLTNLYAHQKSTRNFKATDTSETEIFFGLHIAMGNFKFPTVRMYWDENTKLLLFSEKMTETGSFI